MLISCLLYVSYDMWHIFFLLNLHTVPYVPSPIRFNFSYRVTGRAAYESITAVAAADADAEGCACNTAGAEGVAVMETWEVISAAVLDAALVVVFLSLLLLLLLALLALLALGLAMGGARCCDVDVDVDVMERENVVVVVVVDYYYCCVFR